jgi:uncharacterized protein (DUF1501 family)
MNHDFVPGPVHPSRRSFLVASCAGLAGLRALPSGQAVAAESAPARSTILFFLCGGSSHIDTWDLKPDAPAEYRGPFQPIATSAPGIRLCEHLPLLARQAHHLAVVNGVGGTVNTNDHHAGYYYNLTGHVPDPSFLTLGNDRTPQPDDWPYMGCVVASRRPPHPHLPNAITLPHRPSKAPYTRPGQFAARLGVEHDPLYVHGDLEQPLRFQAPALSLSGDLTASRLQSRRDLLAAVDSARRDLETAARGQVWSTLQERAWGLLASSRTTAAFDVASEPERLRQRYGETVNGMSLLLARRLVEAGVPFVTVFWKENEAIADKCKSAGGWDTHGNNFHCLKEYLLPEFDRGFSALVEDLSDRGLLDRTLLLVTSEMGRMPRIGDPRSGGTSGAGRDHWTHCLSVLMAGGGIRGGQVFGASDRRAEYPAQRRVTPAHITKTVYHAMGITDLSATDPDGRVYNLLDEGEPLLHLF